MAHLERTTPEQAGGATRRVRQAARSHYDTYPYDVDVRDSRIYRSPRSAVGRFLVRTAGLQVLDVGCGPGTLLAAIARHAGRTVGFDVSRVSLTLAARHVEGLPVELVQGDALRLPFREATFDRAIATGTLHHTGDARAAFLELCRVLRPEGEAFVALYRATSYYERMYRTFGALARACERRWPTRALVNRVILLPLFTTYLVSGRLLVHRRLAVPSSAQIMNYFADQLLNPVVSFHTLAEVRGWAAEAGARITYSGTSHGGALLDVEIRRVDSGRGGSSPSGIRPRKEGVR